MSINLKKYGIVRVATAAPKLKIASPDFNADEIISVINEATKNRTNFILFPELSLSSYSCGDLFLSKDFILSGYNSLKRIAEATLLNESTVIIGLPVIQNGKLFNAAAFISNGIILGIVPKSYLCNTSEYYEERWFSSEFDRMQDYIEINNESIPFGSDLLFQSKHLNLTVGIEICEDLWTVKPPSLDQAIAGANLICNLSASNEYLGKKEFRKKIVEMQSAKCFAGYLYSSCGPNESTTDTIFSGQLLYAENGVITKGSNRFNFDSEILYADIDLERIENERIKNNSYGISKSDKKFRIIEFDLRTQEVERLLIHIPQNPFIPDNINLQNDVCQEISLIQSNALIKRLKHIGAKSVVIGISGGSDSTLALLSTVKAFDSAGLDRKNIHAVSMPGLATSTRTRNNAKNLINNLGVTYHEIDISESVKLHLRDIEHQIDNHNIVYENAQARERTQILMDLANKFNGIVIGTGDLSELALGWCTYNADQMSMYGINAGVPKTLIKLVIKWYSEFEFNYLNETLQDILDTPVSPELVPGNNINEIAQESEKILGPYEVHDFFLYYFVRRSYSIEKIFLFANIAYKDKYLAQEIKKWLRIFIERFFSNQFKRSAMPDGIKIGTVSLSPRADWRMPSDAATDLYLQKLNNIKVEE